MKHTIRQAKTLVFPEKKILWNFFRFRRVNFDSERCSYLPWDGSGRAFPGGDERKAKMIGRRFFFGKRVQLY